MRDLRRIPSGMMSSKARERSSSKRSSSNGAQGRDSSNGAQQRDKGSRSSRAVPQFAGGFEGAATLASRRGVETGGPAGAADGGAGAAEDGAGGADEFGEGAGAVAGGAGTVAGAAYRGDGAAAGGDGIGAGGVGGAVVSLGCRKICSLTKELTDDTALSALWRTASTPSKPESCWPRPTRPRKASNRK